MKKLRVLTIGNYATIRSGSALYAGTQVGNYLQTGHNAVIREENQIGDHFCLWSNSIVDYGCKIGSHVKIHSLCYLAQYTTVEDNVFMAPGVIIANDFHPGSKYSKGCMKGPIIKKGAQVGCNVTILPFVTIGEHALIGAGSVVTRDVPPYSVVYGNPARIAKKKIHEISCPVSSHKPYEEMLS
jgi:acetyltransferase-like isoleucine patch superfamily enzyme